ncbi:GNAT family N-acetyltransferase [Agrobacterium arsenijevicii]|uniref:Acetyltransferase n=1 Tax=Agrobacterium arsenijevicii TaxID=1585697 RepID=A0ABR5DC12_9HYPH|nr:acetyltransferase [Agrobacterium arsenijevicii]
MSIVTKTERLHLRKIEDADFVSLGRIYADPKCMQFYPGTKSPSEISAWFQKLAFDSYAQHGFGLWAVVDAVSGEVIGDCGITLQATPAGLEPEIGYHLWREYWGMGLATEAATACRDYAFRTLGLRRVVSITSSENIPSQKVAERVHDRLEIYQKRSGESGNLVGRHLYISENR